MRIRADTPGEVFRHHIGLLASQTGLEVALPKVVLVIDFRMLHLGRLFRLEHLVNDAITSRIHDCG